jgi:3-oxoacyl-(acyl-carrier-protein) synthase
MAACKRVVVTGIGACSPLGHSFVSAFEDLVSNHSGACSLKDDASFSPLPSTIACPVPSSTTLPPLAEEQKSRFLQLAVAASLDALSSASLPLKSESSFDHGVSIGESEDEDEDDELLFVCQV